MLACNRTFALAAFLALAVCVSASPAWADIKHKRNEMSEADKKQRKRELQKKYRTSCPTGTEKMGDLPPDARAMWCEYPTKRGPLSHGNYYKWRKDGGLEGDGQFYMGRKHGKWTEYYPNGRKKGVVTWNNGVRVKDERFDKRGEVVKKADDKEVEKRREKRKARNRRPAVAR